MGLESRTFVRSIAYRDVPVGETTVKVRGLSGLESLAVDQAFVHPAPPMRRNPEKGSLADPEPDLNDPAFQAAQRKLTQDVVAGEAAIACELSLEGTPFPAEARAQGPWIVRAAAWMQSVFSEAQLSTIYTVSRSMSGFDTIKAHAHSLIVEYTPKKDDEKRDPFELPKDWMRSEEGMLMRAAARFGQDPTTWPQSLSATDRAKILAEQMLSMREDAVRDNLLAMLLARLGP
ncbi:MAG: hypothetical protein JSS51_03560 [Planctomycetes bacterium]|nr:hypothetical protein [Planctomycetota bacterium]